MGLGLGFRVVFALDAHGPPISIWIPPPGRQASALPAVPQLTHTFGALIIRIGFGGVIIVQ